MNAKESRYTDFALCREMMAAVDVIRGFDPSRTKALAGEIASVGRLMLTGEGSSRIFPAKNAIRKALTWGLDLQIVTEGSYQSALYDLSNFAVIAASNSGRTKETVSVVQKLKGEGHAHCYGLTSSEDNHFKERATETFVLNCGDEDAIAATKSIIEQALFHQSIVSHIAGRDMKADLEGLAKKFEATLSMKIAPEIVEAAAKAPTVYLAGYTDGVAEELTLKVNEVARKPSDFLEGTYAFHGVAEVMSADDAVFVIEPILETIAKYQKTLIEDIGLKAVAIATEETDLPTLVVPDAGEMNPFIFMAAGWNLIVETGLALGIDLDKPERGQKVGFAF